MRKLIMLALGLWIIVVAALFVAWIRRDTLIPRGSGGRREL